jgi:hypothetical protein
VGDSLERQATWSGGNWCHSCNGCSKNQYTKHQVNDRWYYDGDYIGSTQELYNIYLSDNDWRESNKI